MNNTLREPQPTEILQSTIDHISVLQQRISANRKLEDNALTLNLTTTAVSATGNCLMHAVNTSHQTQTRNTTANHDDLRLVAATLTKEYLCRIQAAENAAENNCDLYPGLFMNALATIRHGPIVVIAEEHPHNTFTYRPLTEMLKILHRIPNTTTKPLYTSFTVTQLPNTTTLPGHFMQRTNPHSKPTERRRR